VKGKDMGYEIAMQSKDEIWLREAENCGLFRKKAFWCSFCDNILKNPNLQAS
jgi:hypothetical protein